MQAADIQRMRSLLQTRDRNFNIFEAYSNYLDQCADYITPEMMREMMNDYHLDELTAYQLLFAAAIGANEDEGEEARYYNEHYIKPSISRLTPETYTNNAFYKNIRIPEKKHGRWQLGTESYKPYEAFIWRDIRCQDNLEEVPQIGFFSETFHFPAVLEDGREWMSTKPNEVETIQPAIDAAKGSVTAFGLGLGYFAYMASEKDEVEQVTVVERDSDAIALFEEITRPQMRHKEKISIIKDDAFNYACQTQPHQRADFAFVDLWHDAADGVELYTRMRQLEHLSPNTTFSYWVEDTLLSHLRWKRLDEMVCKFRNGECDYKTVIEALQNKNLRMSV